MAERRVKSVLNGVINGQLSGRQPVDVTARRKRGNAGRYADSSPAARKSQIIFVSGATTQQRQGRGEIPVWVDGHGLLVYFGRPSGKHYFSSQAALCR